MSLTTIQKRVRSAPGYPRVHLFPTNPFFPGAESGPKGESTSAQINDGEEVIGQAPGS